jgi:cytochrome c-type biogenesis protein CcmF
MTPVVILMMIGPFVRWKGDDEGRIGRILWLSALASVIIGGAVALAIDHVTWRTVLGLSLSAWVLLASVQLLKRRLGERPGTPLANRLRGIPAAWWGMWLAHLGVGVFTIGVTMVGSLDADLDVKMRKDQTAELAGYTFTFRGAQEIAGPNYDADRATIDVTRDGRSIATLTPEKRVYRAQSMPMTEASLDVGPLRDIYVSLGDRVESGAWIVSLHYRPFISWIWLGCILMGLGGIFAAMDRRYRKLAEREAGNPAAAAAHG